MSDTQDRRRRFAPKACTSLIALLHAVQGRKLIFELRNDTIITGKLTSVDDNMK
jgi:small nuclear ribonucleoprotein (snRNP)-like protein